MATLFNTKISATYEGLLKTIDNAAISATLKELTDGSGNQSGLYLNTAGDFKVTSVLEWGSLKDTGTGVTITRYVTSTDGLENFDNNTSLPTSAAVKLYVDTKFATSDTLQEVLSFGNTTSGNDIVVSLNDDITFTDSSKALFGNSQDLEINHNGTDSFVTDLGTGDLRLRSDNSIKIQASTGGNNLATFTKGAGVDLYFNNAKKLETTNTGVSVTGIISNLTNPNAAQDAATKSYVDALDAGSDLDITDGTTTGDVNLNTQTLSILGTTNEIETVVSGQSVTIGLPSSISTDLVGNVTGNLTGDVTGDVSGNVTGNVTGDLAGNVVGNVTGNVTGNVAGDLTGNVTSTSVLANGVTATTQASTDSSTKVATTAYVKGLDNASDLDFSGDSGTGDVNLNAQTFAITGTANQIESSASNQGLSLQFPSAGVTLPNGSLATTQSADDSSTKVATTSYVDTSAALYLPLVGGTMSGNTIHNDSIKSIYGTGSDAQVYHDGSNFYANNSTGQLNIDQSAVTESIVFKTSDANALDTTALIINRGGDLITGRDVTIAGDLTVNGTTTTVNSQTLSVDDPLISLAINNAANSLDIGYYGKYNDGTTRYLGLYNDASDSNKFKLFKGTTVEPTTTVNIGAAGYAAADLELANLISTGTISGVLANGVTATTQTAGDNSTKVATTAYANAAASAIPIGDYLPLVGGTLTGDLTISKAGTPLFQLVDTTNNVSLLLGADDSNIFLRSSSGSMFFQTNGGTSALTLDSSQNATFAGNVALGGTGQYTTNQSLNIDGTGLAIKNNVNGSSNNWSYIHNTATASNSNLVFATGSSLNALTLAHNGNATFAETITVQGTGDSYFVGNVGIGTDSPNAKLHVKGGSISTPSNNSDFITNATARLVVNHSNEYGAYVGYLNSTNDAIGIQSSKSNGVTTPLSLNPYGGNVGIGTASPRAKLDISTPDPSTNFEVLDFRNPSDFGIFATSSSVSGKGNTLDFKSSDYNSGAGIQTRNLLSLQPSGNVGIGTDSPSEKLEVDGNVQIGSTTDAKLYMVSTGGNGANERFFIEGYAYGGTYGGGFKLSTRNNSNVFNTAVTVDGIGNVGIGTPSPDTELHVKGSATVANFEGTGGAVFIGLKDSDDGTIGYMGVDGGKIKFQTSGSGYSDKLVIDTVGNVGIGTDSPDTKLEILKSGTNTFPTLGTADGNLYLTDGGLWGMFMGVDSSSGTGWIQQMRNDSAVAYDISLNPVGGNVGIGTDNPNNPLHIESSSAVLLNLECTGASSFAQLSNSGGAAGIKSTANDLILWTSTSGTERMRITSGGDVNIKGNNTKLGWARTSDGVSNIAYLTKTQTISTNGEAKLHGYDGIIFTSDGAEIQRMRITGGGAVNIGYIGTLGGFGTEDVSGIYYSGGNTGGYTAINSNSNNAPLYLARGASTPTGILINMASNGTGVGSISITGSATAYNTSSDYRLKEDLQDFAGLDMVSKIPVYDYKWKADKSRSYGVMAHELQEVLPQAVVGEKDAEEMQGVDYSKIVPLLIKSIQELTAKVERLEAK